MSPRKKSEGLSIEAISREIKADRRTVKAAIIEAEIQPLGKKGNASLYDLDEVILALTQRKENKAENSSLSDRVKIQQERLLKARANKAEYELSLLEGTCFRADLITEVLESVIIEWRGLILALTSKLSPNLVGVSDVRESYKQVDDSVRGVLTDMARIPIGEIVQRISDKYKIEQGINSPTKQFNEEKYEKI